MGLEKTIEKLDKYFRRFETGKAERIKPSDVDKAIRKLQAKEQLIRDELSEATKDAKITRLKHKLEMVQEQQERARWLKGKIGDGS